MCATADTLLDAASLAYCSSWVLLSLARVVGVARTPGPSPQGPRTLILRLISGSSQLPTPAPGPGGQRTWSWNVLPMPFFPWSQGQQLYTLRCKFMSPSCSGTRRYLFCPALLSYQFGFGIWPARGAGLCGRTTNIVRPLGRVRRHRTQLVYP